MDKKIQFTIYSALEIVINEEQNFKNTEHRNKFKKEFKSKKYLHQNKMNNDFSLSYKKKYIH